MNKQDIQLNETYYYYSGGSTYKIYKCFHLYENGNKLLIQIFPEYSEDNTYDTTVLITNLSNNDYFLRNLHTNLMEIEPIIEKKKLEEKFNELIKNICPELSGEQLKQAIACLESPKKHNLIEQLINAIR